jgi:hypothetical protein
MMPSFARGWEKDGWEPYTDKWVCLQGEPFKHSFAYYVSVDGDLVVEAFKDEESGPRSIGKTLTNHGDPLTAKKRAETLMEGL